MVTEKTEDAYCTLLMSDSYLPGAMVLAHSLRDAGTKKKLAVLIILDSLKVDTITELKSVYDYVIPVERIVNKTPANLYLMNRPDLGSTFTKINLWRQSQFRKIVYVDADVVSLRAPDELFNLESRFAAAPDIGWPDLFNSGVMVLNPNLQDYYSLLAMAQRGISFDGADQGLLNMHFRSYDRISFQFNVTPSAHYQYVPAYKHFQSSISLVHFIGPDKPWQQGREVSTTSGSPADELLGRWWAAYDRHYRAPTTAHISGQGSEAPRTVQNYVAGETHGVTYGFSSSGASVTRDPEHTHIVSEQPMHEETESKDIQAAPQITPTETRPQRQFSAPMVEWNPASGPPPSDSRPEASNFPSTTYEMSHDRELFHAPASYPKPPKDLWYKPPETPPTGLAPIFPWEQTAPKPSRIFFDDQPTSPPVAPPSMSEASTTEEVSAGGDSTPTTPHAGAAPATDPWQSYTQTNAWDDDPEIDQYVSNLQKSRRGKIQVLKGTAIEDVSSPTTERPGERRPSMKLTDFPSEVERPSLPVTPAPIRRPSFWGSERDAEGELPPAEGVPSQAEWDPATKLDELTRRQSEVLPAILNQAEGGSSSSSIPDRTLPESAVLASTTGAPA